MVGLGIFVTVKPSLIFNIELSISGRDRNWIKEYLYQTYECALREGVDLRTPKPENYSTWTMQISRWRRMAGILLPLSAFCDSDALEGEF